MATLKPGRLLYQYRRSDGTHQRPYLNVLEVFANNPPVRSLPASLMPSSNVSTCQSDDKRLRSVGEGCARKRKQRIPAFSSLYTESFLTAVCDSDDILSGMLRETRKSSGCGFMRVRWISLSHADHLHYRSTSVYQHQNDPTSMRTLSKRKPFTSFRIMNECVST